MNTHADKTQENKSQSVANEVSKKTFGGESTFQFIDNRTEAIAQRKLHEMANNSPRTMQLRAIQEMANSPQAKQAAQLQSMADNYAAKQHQPIQKKVNKTGLPDNLKAGIENLSGYSMDDVKVHYNFDKPAQLQAHAYAQGTDIHVASGQEKHLPHEAWHVVQQKQGRVKPTMQMKVNVNDDTGLEHEADVMGVKALINAAQLKGEPEEDELLQGKFEPVQSQDPEEEELLQGKFEPVQRATVTSTPPDSTTYKIMNIVPGTGVRVVRKNWKPFSPERYLVDANNKKLAIVLTVAEAGQLINVMNNLVAQGTVNMDSLIEEMDKASQLGVPAEVGLARMNLIHDTLRDVVRVRIQADHETIRGMHPGTLDANFGNAFRSIEMPGSDPHKGGQVVAYINYNTLAGGTLRVVYKPSNLSVDMLLYNDNANSVANTLAGGLASYHMEPMVAVAAPDERLQHYGYMEFVDSGGPTNALQVLSVFNSLGANLAMAYVFGLRDIHGGNFLLLNDRLQFIDMEAATGTFTGFAAMDMLQLPNALRDKIVKNLGGIDNATVTAWMPNSPALQTEVVNGFTATLAAMGPGGGHNAAMAASVVAMSNARARFVPFATNELQGLAGRFFGQLAAPTPATTASFNHLTQNLATTTAGPGAPPALVADLLTMLRDQTTQDAFNTGDVPYWTRQGNQVFGEDGVQQIAQLAHPRLNTTANIANDANARRTPVAPGPATPLALLNAQVIPAYANMAAGILNQHQILRQAAGHEAPNF